jgi:hypothetical protein
MTPKLSTTLVCAIGLILSALPCASVAQTLSLGTVSSSTALSNCSTLQNPGTDFRNFDSHMTNCFTATLTGCTVNDAGVSDLYFVWGYAMPTAPPYKGTIVMLPGDGGENAATDTTFQQYISQYLADGYQVVEVAWGAYGGGGVAWEASSAASILYAACRPASFLNWIRNGPLGSVGLGRWQATQGGMCVHADSGGAGAAANALAWFNGGAGGTAASGAGYIDKAVMENGPVFSDVERGCEIQSNGTNGQNTQICTGSPAQTGC